jgi:hypothetical protein
MDRFNKATLAALRPEVQAALDAIAEKHGITLKLGNIGFSPDGGSFTSKVEGKVEAIANEAEHKRFLEYAAMYGYDPEKVAETPQGKVRLVGFNPKARSKPWIIAIEGETARRICDDRYCDFYFKKPASERPALVETAPPARSAGV